MRCPCRESLFEALSADEEPSACPDETGRQQFEQPACLPIRCSPWITNEGKHAPVHTRECAFPGIVWAVPGISRRSGADRLACQPGGTSSARRARNRVHRLPAVGALPFGCVRELGKRIPADGSL